MDGSDRSGGSNLVTGIVLQSWTGWSIESGETSLFSILPPAFYEPKIEGTSFLVLRLHYAWVRALLVLVDFRASI